MHADAEETNNIKTSQTNKLMGENMLRESFDTTY